MGRLLERSDALGALLRWAAPGVCQKRPFIGHADTPNNCPYSGFTSAVLYRFGARTGEGAVSRNFIPPSLSAESRPRDALDYR